MRVRWQRASHSVAFARHVFVTCNLHEEQSVKLPPYKLRCPLSWFHLALQRVLETPIQARNDVHALPEHRHGERHRRSLLVVLVVGAVQHKFAVFLKNIARSVLGIHFKRSGHAPFGVWPNTWNCGSQNSTRRMQTRRDPAGGRSQSQDEHPEARQVGYNNGK